jgi:hypothetical protein
MSQNPANSVRPALAPPAVTRFQLRIGSAAEAVFAPPFVAPRPDAVRYAGRRAPTVSYSPTSPRERRRRPADAAPSSARPAHSIHDPEHDSWPVAAPDGSAIPAWAADSDVGEATAEGHQQSGANSAEDVVPGEAAESGVPLELTAQAEDVIVGAGKDTGIGAPLLELSSAEGAPELELLEAIDNQGGGAAAAAATSVTEPYLERPDAPRDPAFPLDAFIVPTGAYHVPAEYDDRGTAARVADELEELARQIRAQGLTAIGSGSPEQLARVLGAILTGYIARDP